MIFKIIGNLFLLEFMVLRMLNVAFVFIISVGLFRLGLTLLFQLLDPIKKAKKINKLFDKTLELFYSAVSAIPDASKRQDLLDKNCENLGAVCVEEKKCQK